MGEPSVSGVGVALCSSLVAFVAARVSVVGFSFILLGTSAQLSSPGRSVRVIELTYLLE